jgi:hypothetical protein
MSRFARLFACLALVALAGCSSQQKSSPSTEATADGGTAPAGAFKIGLMTGTVSQSEEEFRAGEQIARKYGARLKHVTYPDNFMNEQETVIAQLSGLAADPTVKVIIVGQAIPGSIAAARKIREQRPDILIGFVEPHEDPQLVEQACDIAILPDQLARGRSIIAEAKAMGAEHFVHYSFPRHMSQELLSRRRDIMKQAASEMGMTFSFVTAPDPMAEGGLPATQQFVLEDVPREIQKLGGKTAFFSTNCGMQEPLIKSVLTYGGYIAEQCCPSPTHGYPAALGIAIPPGKAGDIAFINAENKRVIAEHHMTGHFGTWVAPESMIALRAMTDLLVDAVDRKADVKDMGTVQRYMAKEAGADVMIARYQEPGHQYLVMLDHQVY